MKSEMGETAGEVYKLLESQGPMTLTQLKKKLNARGEMTSYALGWLAREDKIDFVVDKKATYVQLK
ncbi:MAG: winged helix-turn-helix domain-containing protein [Acidobacteriia bacterium]|nr:winged helix-turn-helix domain-containing protein [Terriglobia bacterium]